MSLHEDADFSYLLARHAKRVTLMVEDIRLLRQIWKIIQPSNLLAEDTQENIDNRVLKETIETHRIREAKRRLATKVAKLRAAGRLCNLTIGERNFMRGNAMPVPPRA
jgi:hypothetical protein